jgi:hypothetical protein
MDLLSRNVDLLVPLLSRLQDQVSCTPFISSKCDVADFVRTAPQSVQDLLIKEAVYCVFGMNSSYLSRKTDFDPWFEKTLIPEATGTDPR